jgi:hypothetical protein
MGKGLSLSEFAAANGGPNRGTAPWIESLPEWPEIFEAYKAGVKLYQIRTWLISERGYPAAEVTRSRVAYLSRNHSDE